MQNRTFLVVLRSIFSEKLKIAPPIGKQPPSNVRISELGRTISLKIGEELFFLFFGDHLILGGKNLWISEIYEKFRLNFRANRVKLIQEQWKFGSRSFAHFSLFQNSPPPFPNPGYAPGYSPLIGMSTEMQNKKNTTFVALLRLFHALEWTK